MGTHSYFARCPQRPRALLALRPSQLAAADTAGPITWACRAPRVPGTKALAAAGRWGLQAGPHCDAGAQLRSACPSRGHAPPCVTLASLARLISLGEGSDSA